MWNKITVGQFQAIYKLSQDTTMQPEDIACGIISILYNMTLAQVDELPMETFNELSKQSAAMLNVENMPGKPVRILKASGKKYGIIYDPTKLKHRQYVETITYGDKPIENMHLVMASIVQPVTYFGRWLPNDVNKHADIAADLQQARMIDVYHSCVFFCKLYLNSMQAIKPYLISEMMQKGMSQEAATKLLTTSINTLAGHILPEKSQPSKVSRWMQPMSYH